MTWRNPIPSGISPRPDFDAATVAAIAGGNVRRLLNL